MWDLLSKKNWDMSRWFLIIVGIAAALLLGSYFWTFRGLRVDVDPNAWGSFGSYIGGVLGPLVSAFTLVIARKVWLLQKKELDGTKKALEEQAAIAEKNRSEQRFFDLMEVYHQTLDSFKRNKKEYLISGKPAIDGWFADIGYPVRYVMAPPGSGYFDEQEKDSYQYAWTEAAGVYEFSHYFRVVFRILSDAEDFFGSAHYDLMRLFRAQLSQSELLLIAMNVLCDTDARQMRAKIFEYGLLKHIPNSPFRKILEEELDPRAFGRKFAAARTQAVSFK